MAASKKNWIGKAAKSIKRRGTAGKCTPITKPGCTGRARALALTFKKIARNRKKHELGGYLLPQYGGDVGSSMLPSGYARGLDYDVAGSSTGGIGGFNPLSAGIGAALNIGNAIAGNFVGASEANEQDIYNQAQQDLRQVDVGQMGRFGRQQALGKNWWNLGIGAIGSKSRAETDARLFNEQMTEQKFNKDVSSRMATIPQNKSYMPVAKQGGFTIYKGETHDGPTGGILTDEQGNPTGLSNNKPIALTEKDEVARYNPHTGSTYIYSKSLGFAKPATDLVNKYELDKSNSEYKYNPLLAVAVDKQFDNLQTAQEFTKSTNTSMEDSLGMFKKGGSLNAAKAKEMLKNPPHNRPLTAKQRRYFYWVAGGRKDFGGFLEFGNGGNLTGKRKASLTVRNNSYFPLTDLNVDSELRNRGLVSDTLKTITPQMRVNAILSNPDLGYSVSQGNPTANRGGYNYWQVGKTSQVNPRTSFVGNEAFNRTIPITEPIMQDGGGLSRAEDYGSKKKPYPMVKSKDFAGGGRSYPIPTIADARDALSLAGLHGRADVRAKVLKRYPSLRKEEGGLLFPILENGGYVKKRKRHATYPFLPIPEAPLGAYTHSAVEEFGGELPIYQGLPGEPSVLPADTTMNKWMAAQGYVQDYYGGWHLNPQQMEDRFGKKKTVSNQWSGSQNIGLPPIFNPFKLVQWRQDIKNQSKPGWGTPDAGQRWDPFQNENMTAPGFYSGVGLFGDQGVNTIPQKIIQVPINNEPIDYRTPAQAGYEESPVSIPRSTEPSRVKYNPIEQTRVKYDPIGQLDTSNLQNLYNRSNQLSTGLAKGPTMFQPLQDESYTPTLSPLGHVASAIGSLVDYGAMSRAKPENVSLPRVGAERISLAQQRLANERNAAGARAINTTSGRGLGMNAGATMTNTAVANTGVNRLLGQQNAESLMNEENTNAQLRQQANMVNAELAAQEHLFNTQSLNAYRMAKARMNIPGNLSRIAASYFADNAAYGKGYDIAKMLSPNAEIYKPKSQTYWERLLGKGPGVDMIDKSLYTPEELQRLRKNR